MSKYEDIVIESVNHVQSEFFTQEDIDSRNWTKLQILMGMSILTRCLVI